MDRLLQGYSLKGGLGGLGRSGSRATSPLPLEGAGEFVVFSTSPETAAKGGHPVSAFLILAEPVVATDADHDAPKLSLPTLAIGTIRGEGLPVDVRNTGDARDGGITAVSGELGVARHGDVEAECLTSKSEHNEDEVSTNDPETANDQDALEAFRLCHSVPERIRPPCVGTALCFGGVILGAGEASGLGDGLTTRSRGVAVVVMLRHNQEPGHTESCSIGGIY